MIKDELTERLKRRGEGSFMENLALVRVDESAGIKIKIATKAQQNDDGCARIDTGDTRH